MKGDTSGLGAISEVKACAWLMEQGFYVFRAMQPSGPADLAAWHPTAGFALLIDVKTVRPWINKAGERRLVWGSNSADPRVSYLGFCPDTGEFVWLDNIAARAQTVQHPISGAQRDPSNAEMDAA